MLSFHFELKITQKQNNKIQGVSKDKSELLNIQYMYLIILYMPVYSSNKCFSFMLKFGPYIIFFHTLIQLANQWDKLRKWFTIKNMTIIYIMENEIIRNIYKLFEIYIFKCSSALNKLN